MFRLSNCLIYGFYTTSRYIILFEVSPKESGLMDNVRLKNCTAVIVVSSFDCVIRHLGFRGVFLYMIILSCHMKP